MNRILIISITIFIFGFLSVSAATPVVKEPVTTESKVEAVSPATGLDKAETKLRSILGPIYDSLEIYRKKQADYFTIARDKTKLKLGINLAEDAIERIKPFLAPPPAPSAIPGTDTVEGLEIKKLDNPTDYGKLIIFSALASLFASIWMFYTVLVLLIFFLIRLVFRMIV